MAGSLEHEVRDEGDSHDGWWLVGLKLHALCFVFREIRHGRF